MKLVVLFVYKVGRYAALGYLETDRRLVDKHPLSSERLVKTVYADHKYIGVCSRGNSDESGLEGADLTVIRGDSLGEHGKAVTLFQQIDRASKPRGLDSNSVKRDAPCSVKEPYEYLFAVKISCGKSVYPVAVKYRAEYRSVYKERVVGDNDGASFQLSFLGSLISVKHLWSKNEVYRQDREKSYYVTEKKINYTDYYSEKRF